MISRRFLRRPALRRAAVAVEFAFVAPVLIAIALSIIEVSRAYNAQNILETAAREGARFASMDREGLLRNGQTTNSKMINDVTNFLASSGIDRNVIEVTVTDAETGSPFDLDDTDNDLRLFEVGISVPYSSVSYLPVTPGRDFTMRASIIFRNGRATLSQ